MRRVLRSRSLISLLIVTVLILGGWLVWSMANAGDGSSGGAAGTPPGGEDAGGQGSGGNGSEDRDGGDSGDGGGGAGGDGGGGAGGSSEGSGSGLDGSSSGGGGGGSDRAGSGANPLPPGGMCGPQEFLGDLIPFIKTVGDPDSIVAFSVSSAPPSGPLSAPKQILGGFNAAYGPIADLLPDECGSISGEPHVVTLDGLRYNFQAVGEYWALRSSDGSFGVQIRTLPYNTSERVTSVKGVATRVDGHVLVIDSTADELVTVDGQPLGEDEVVFTDNGGAIISVESGVAVYWPDGFTSLAVTHIRKLAMSVYFTVGEELQGQVGGLMGNVDGDPSNDLALADGSVIEKEFEAIHGPFRDAWRVSDEDMLFSRPSVFRDDIPVEEVVIGRADRNAARETCVAAGVVVAGLLEDCVFDVAVTGEDAFAELYAQNQLDRVSIIQQGCDLDLAGEVVMEGFGPHRTWQVSSAELVGESVWIFEYEDGQVPKITRVLPVGDRAVVIDTRNGVHIIDKTGLVELTVELSPIAGVEPLIVGDAVFVATEEGLAAVGLDGSICWHLILRADEEISTLGFSEGLVVATTIAARNSVSLALAIDPTSGEIVWERLLQSRVFQFGADIAPVMTEDVAVFESAAGGLMALELDSGELAWIYESSRPNESVSALSLANGVIFVVGRQSGLTALHLDSGELIWNLATKARVPRKLAVGETMAVVFSERGAHGIDLKDGSVAWFRDDIRFRSGDHQPVISGSTVYFFGDSRQLVGVDLSSGGDVGGLVSDLGSSGANANGAFASSPVIWGDLFLIVDKRGHLESFR